MGIPAEYLALIYLNDYSKKMGMDLEDYYSFEYLAEVTKSIHEFIKQTGLNLWDNSSNEKLKELALVYDPDNTMSPDPVFLLVTVIRQTPMNEVSAKYFKGIDNYTEIADSFKEWVGDAAKYVADVTVNPIWKNFKWPLIIGGSLLFLMSPASQFIFGTLNKKMKR